MLRGFTIVASTVALVLMVAAFPTVYNLYFFSLARLKNDLSPGEQYDSVLQKFERYREEYETDGEFQMTVEENVLFIYHVNVFDDCQLTVEFTDGRVSQISYIGD